MKKLSKVVAGLLYNDIGKKMCSYIEDFNMERWIQRLAFHFITSQSSPHETPSFDKHETLPFCCVLSCFCLNRGG